jgi:hypothetical protein
MPGWTALLLATPLFGLSLTPPAVDGAMLGTPAAVVDFSASLPMPGLLQVDDAALAAEAGAPPPTATPAVASADDTAQAEADRRYTEDVMRRRELGQIHRAFGIATWIAMTGNLVIGMMQYSDLYGFGAGQNGNPCASGQGIVLDECTGDPWAHIISASTTTTLYSATFILSLSMPDPNEASVGNGAFAEHLRIHEALRWVHSIGMLLQVVMGAMMSNGVFGDRANNYDVLQAMAAVHQTIGWVTWGALTGAAAVMLF